MKTGTLVIQCNNVNRLAKIMRDHVKITNFISKPLIVHEKKDYNLSLKSFHAKWPDSHHSPGTNSLQLKFHIAC